MIYINFWLSENLKILGRFPSYPIRDFFRKFIRFKKLIFVIIHRMLIQHLSVIKHIGQVKMSLEEF